MPVEPAHPDLNRAADKPLWVVALHALWQPTLLAVLVWWSGRVGYLFAHTLAELISIVVALAALAVATTSVRFTRNHFVVFVAVAIGWCATLDLLHTLVFKGMQLIASDSANPATQFWIAARFMQAMALFMAPWMLRRTVHVGWLHLCFGTWSVASVALIGTGHFPEAYVDGQGLTDFKIVAEYVIIGLMAAALWRLWIQRALMAPRQHMAISAAVMTMMASEFAFTQYVGVYAPANLVGHILKIYAYWFVYMALVQATLREPFGALSRAASTYDAIPEPTFIVTPDGLILQANKAASQYLRQPVHGLVGQHCHALLHDPRLTTQDCPVCRRLKMPATAFLMLLNLPEERAVECHVAPFTADLDHDQAWVQVVREVSARQRMTQEREQLIQDLGERVKELHCLHTVSELTQRTGLGLPAMFEELVSILPAGFVAPDRLCVRIESLWGHFGPHSPEETYAHCLRVDLAFGHRQAGHISVWYPNGTVPPAPAFLPEEHTLLRNVALLFTQTIARTQAQERVQHLSHLYEMLSTTNRAVARCHNREELLDALKNALLARKAFAMLFIGLTDTGWLPVRRVFTHGIGDEHLPLLDRVLTHPQSPLAQVQTDLCAGRVAVLGVPAAGAPATADSDAQLRQWAEHLQNQGIRQQAVMPLMALGHLVGVVGLYAESTLEVDTEQIRLLEDMAADIEFALNRFVNDDLRQAAEATAQQMEHRFEKVFLASPVPMQIHSLAEKRIRSINEAHQRWLGYTLDEIATEEDWFLQVYPDPAIRQQLRDTWSVSVEEALQGHPVHSPELSLRCKDGSIRIARGTMTVVNDGAVLAWTDLTDVRRNEQALRDSEQRFRGMVEQTVTGMYVRRDGKFIYVNPRYCDIVGWSAEELLGKDVLEFTPHDPDNISHIRAAWTALHESPTQSASYAVTVRRKDGQLIEMSLHAKVITWDDGLSATIVIGQDITERKRAEDQIAAYVRQLEASMRGTLQAVSNMVEMRDPYTAGHERRVGLLASAIAHEMGWSDEHCKALEMLGLVHDIGKIAVPSEILTKPTRLSRLEMELMKGHAEAGYDILKDVPFSTPVAEIIRQHHERMDGSGYPRGLKGDAILPEARVLAVADVIESMASHRPYRAAVGLEAALAEVVNNAGSAYDPEVTAAAVRLITEKGYQLPK